MNGPGSLQATPFSADDASKSMILPSVILIASHLVLPVGSPPRQADCIAGPHDPLRVRRLPGVAATTSRPRNPLEDEGPHCVERGGEAAPNNQTGQKPALRDGSR